MSPSWRPGRVTVILLAIATLSGAWLLAPPWWGRSGTDARVAYAAAAISDAGGNPYDLDLLHAEETRLARAAPPGSEVVFQQPAYAYPPVLTALWQLLLPLGERGFYAANAIALLVAGLLAFRTCAICLDWTAMRVGAWAMLVSAPFVLGLVFAGVSNFVLLAWAMGLYALARGRPTLAGAVLALAMVRPPIGMAMLVALALAGPGTAGLLLLGFGAGVALFLAVNLLVLGPGALASWVETLGRAGAGGGARPPGWGAGVPALLAVHLPAIAAAAVGLVIVGAILAVALGDSRSRASFTADRPLRLGVLCAALLAATPFLRIDDLVFEVVPLMLLSSRRMTPVAQATLVTWALGVTLPLVAAVALAAILHDGSTAVLWFGPALSVLVLLGVTSSLRPPRPARPARLDRGRHPGRPWGPVSRA